MPGNSSGSYKIQAQVKDGDTLELRTDSRDRARYYAGVMMQNPSYETVLVEAGGLIYIGEAIGRMP